MKNLGIGFSQTLDFSRGGITCGEASSYPPPTQLRLRLALPTSAQVGGNFLFSLKNLSPLSKPLAYFFHQQDAQPWNAQPSFYVLLKAERSWLSDESGKQIKWICFTACRRLTVRAGFDTELS